MCVCVCVGARLFPLETSVLYTLIDRHECRGSHRRLYTTLKTRECCVYHTALYYVIYHANYGGFIQNRARKVWVWYPVKSWILSSLSIKSTLYARSCSLYIWYLGKKNNELPIKLNNILFDSTRNAWNRTPLKSKTLGRELWLNTIYSIYIRHFQRHVTQANISYIGIVKCQFQRTSCNYLHDVILMLK